MQTINALLKVSYLSVKTKAQAIVITEKKTCSKKVQKLKKKVWLRQGLSQQLSWLTMFVDVVLTGMYHSK